MIPKECKRLAEVDFPIAVVSAHAAREKSIRHGHPSTLHLWWARRPLAACRSMLLALLLPDPADPLCPGAFKAKARELLPLAGAVPADGSDLALRRALLKFIGDFADWDHAGLDGFLNVARGLVKAAHPDETPLVVDPFAGGGSIPLEALRVGCEAFASDLNPVACLINKVLLEDIPRHGPELAQQLRAAGEKVKAAAAAELAPFYPPDEDGAKPIAYLWARTVRCESGGCGAEIPLMKSFWLSKKEGRYRALRPVEPCKPPLVQFEVYTPKNDSDVRVGGTVIQAKATCLCCGKTLPPARVRAQLSEQRGGADVVFDANGNRTGGARLLVVVTLKDGQSGRQYRIGSSTDYEPVFVAQRRAKELASVKHENGLSGVPTEIIPPTERRRISIPIYGMLSWGDCFTSRQKVTLTTLAAKTRSSSRPIRRLLTLACSRVSERLSCLARWDNSAKMESIAGTFARHALGMVWDFAEQNPFANVGGNWDGAVDWIAQVAEMSLGGGAAQVVNCDAAQSPLPTNSAGVWFTDPPYYDSIPYAHLSDYFYVWIRRALADVEQWFAEELTPKEKECVVDRPHILSESKKNAEFFEAKLQSVMAEGRRLLQENGVGCVVFAHKSTEGWERLLSGMFQAGWTVTASWPITTEMATRLIARETASLAASIHLVCRPRSPDAPPGDWDDVQQALPGRIAEWMARLQQEGVRGADLVFACIGPALEVYSRYPRVLDAQDRPIPLGGDPEAKEPHQRGFLAYVWEQVGKAALQEVLKGASNSATGLDDDARLTALFLWTLQTTATKAESAEPDGGDEDEPEDDTDEDEDADAGSAKKAKGFALPFDVVRRIAQPLGIRLEALANRTIATTKGVVRLLPVTERADQLFGKGGLTTAADDLARPSKVKRQDKTGTIEGMEDAPVELASKKRKGKKASAGDVVEVQEPTTLDRVHQAMLLLSAGETARLRELLKEQTARGPEFLRLANALSPLYPPGSWEKQKLDAMLQAIPK